MYSNKQTNKKEACGAHEYSLYLTEQQQQNLSAVSISIPLELPHESSCLVWYKTIGCKKLLKHRDSVDIKQLIECIFLYQFDETLTFCHQLTPQHLEKQTHCMGKCQERNIVYVGFQKFKVV